MQVPWQTKIIRGGVYFLPNLRSYGDSRRGETEACLVCNLPFRHLLYGWNSTTGSVCEVERDWLKHRVCRLDELFRDTRFFEVEEPRRMVRSLTRLT